jgi:hypothetical protein
MDPHTALADLGLTLPALPERLANYPGRDPVDRPSANRTRRPVATTQPVLAAHRNFLQPGLIEVSQEGRQLASVRKRRLIANRWLSLPSHRLPQLSGVSGAVVLTSKANRRLTSCVRF